MCQTQIQTFEYPAKTKKTTQQQQPAAEKKWNEKIWANEWWLIEEECGKYENWVK